MPQQGPGTRFERILAGAAEAFSERGFAATSMRDIARRTGTSPGTIYYHFDSKEGILRELICGNFRRVIDSLDQRLQDAADPAGRLAVFIDNHIRFFAGHLAEMRVMSHELDTLHGVAGAEVERLRDEYLERAIAILSRLRPEITRADLRLDALCLFGMLNWTYRWFHTVDPADGPARVATRMTRLFLAGFVPSSGSSGSA